MTSSPVTMPLGQQLSALQALRAAIALPPAPSNIEELGAACSNAHAMILAPHEGASPPHPLSTVPRAAWRIAHKTFSQGQARVHAQLYRDARGTIDHTVLKREEVSLEALEGYARMGVIAEKAVRAFTTSAAHYLGRALAKEGITMGVVWRAALEYSAPTGPSMDSWRALQHFFEMTPFSSPELPGPHEVTGRSTDMRDVRTALGEAIVKNTLLLARYGTPYVTLWCEKQGIDDDLITSAVVQGVVAEQGARQLFDLCAASLKTERAHRVLIRVIGGLMLAGAIAAWIEVFHYASVHQLDELKEAPYVALPILGALFASMAIMANPNKILKWR